MKKTKVNRYLTPKDKTVYVIHHVIRRTITATGVVNGVCYTVEDHVSRLKWAIREVSYYMAGNQLFNAKTPEAFSSMTIKQRNTCRAKKYKVIDNYAKRSAKDRKVYAKERARGKELAEIKAIKDGEKAKAARDARKAEREQKKNGLSGK